MALGEALVGGDIGRDRPGGLLLVGRSEPSHLAYAKAASIALQTFSASGKFDPQQDVLLDVDLTDIAVVRALKGQLIRTRPHTLTVFVNPDLRVELVHAAVLGATKLLSRGITVPEFLASWKYGGAPVEPVIALAQGAAAIAAIMDSAQRAQPLPLDTIEHSAAAIIKSLRSSEIDVWMSLVRRHHTGTHQHCLLVTSAATGWGTFLGMPNQDLLTVTTAGLLHDVGKAFIPEIILDKPSALNEAELKVMRRHPVTGAAYLKSNIRNEQVLDVVRHHHEFLDGSGYPDKLVAADIADLTRFMTICDIYGALVESRPYKPPFTTGRALGVLTEMADGGKIDASMLKSFAAWLTASSASQTQAKSA